MMALVSLTGCSDDGSSVETLGGFEASQSVETLDTAEVADFCTAATAKSVEILSDAQATVDKSFTSICALQAVTPGENPATDEASCEAFVATCVENYTARYGNLTDQAIAMEDCQSTDWTTCSMTVGEFSVCMSDMQASLTSMFPEIDSVSCAWAVNATAAEVLEKASKLQDQAGDIEESGGPPASCIALNDKCSSLGILND